MLKTAVVTILLGALMQPCFAAANAAAPPVSLTAQLNGESFSLPNAFGVAFAAQPVRVPLSAPAPAGDAVVVDENGAVVGQLASDKRSVLLRAGFEAGQTSRTFKLSAGDAIALAAIQNPVQVQTQTWTADQAQAAGTVFPNGIASYFEIANGLCGVRIPATLVKGALPGPRVPAPVVGVNYPDGEWAGRPDFRALLIPPRHIDNGVITREPWKFTAFKSELVEQGPIETTARVSVTMSNRPGPYVFEITLYAGEKFFKFHQLTGHLNDWFLDLNLDKTTAWRPTRVRTGAVRQWKPAIEQTLPDRKLTYKIGFSNGPGPAAGRPNVGEGESDLFSHDVWAEFGEGDLHPAQLLQPTGAAAVPAPAAAPAAAVSASAAATTAPAATASAAKGAPGAAPVANDASAFALSGPVLWGDQRAYGSEAYAFDPAAAPAAPVAGLLVGPASELSGWSAKGNPWIGAGFCLHVPAWLDADTKASGSVLAGKYMENDRYQGVADRNSPIFGIRFAMRVNSGSYFVWLGQNSDIAAAADDPQFTADYRSPLWQSYDRYASGIANLGDDLAWSAPWPDPPGGGAFIEPDAIAHNVALAAKGEPMGDSPLFSFLRLTTDAQRIAAVDAGLKTLQNDPASGVAARIRGARNGVWGDLNLDLLNAWFALGHKGNAGGLLSDDQWSKLKALAAFYCETTFDEDRAPRWDADPSDRLRNEIALKFPTWPDSASDGGQPAKTIETALKAAIGRWGAPATGTRDGAAGMPPLLGDLIELQWLSYKQPKTYPDLFATDPSLRDYAFYILNRTGVADPRYHNLRMPMAVGQGGAGLGAPEAALLASGFRHVDPRLSSWLMWAWQAGGKPRPASPSLPILFDYTLPAEPYSFAPVASFPGATTVQRVAAGKPVETAVAITDGSFFDTHRDAAEDGELTIDALGKPLVTNPVSGDSPAQNGALYRNTVGLADSHWDADSYYGGLDAKSDWGDDRVTAIGSFKDGSYSCSEFSAVNPALKGGVWRRQVALIRPDLDMPIIYVRDQLSKPADYMATFWMQTEGPVDSPGGMQLRPPLKTGSSRPGPVSLDSSPSAIKVPAKMTNHATFGFTGHDWDKLFPALYGKPDQDVGSPVDVVVNVIHPGVIQAALGQWHLTDGTEPTTYDDRQYLRIKFHGTENVTVFTPYFHGHTPLGLQVLPGANGSVVVSYVNAAKAKRSITISPLGYRIDTNGQVTDRAAFPTAMPAKLYPGSKDEFTRR